ncbi:carbon starvation CstA family protein [Pontibacter korlensis]|uniref:carbon starvation CstA family protein n=1 Tax=Pontibacter korlensis TaxID=400092 RepID=UPI0008FF8D64|nr:carbon starvation CstA family protein [Pontibacter korlensis]
MISFFVSVIALLLGYLLYSKFIERVFGIELARTTPAIALRANVDYVPMPGWKIFLVQFLNFAGLGPIVGAVAGPCGACCFYIDCSRYEGYMTIFLEGFPT